LIVLADIEQGHLDDTGSVPRARGLLIGPGLVITE
jgi:hypothetical protein